MWYYILGDMKEDFSIFYYRAKWAVRFVSLSLAIAIFLGEVSAQPVVFSPFERAEDLRDDQIRFVNQLKDGRMLIITESTINLYNVGAVKNIGVDAINLMPLKRDEEIVQAYVDDKRVWVKNRRSLLAVDIATEKCIEKPLSLLQSWGVTGIPDNLFGDSYKDVWIVTGNEKLFVCSNQTGKATVFLNSIYANDQKSDQLCDVARIGDQVFVIYKSGIVRCFDRKTARELYQIRLNKSLSHWSASLLQATVVGNYLYLFSNANNRVIRIDTRNGQVQTLLEYKGDRVNNITCDPDMNVSIASKKGFWLFKAGESTGEFFDEIQMVDGKKMRSGITNVYMDNQRGLWVGTHVGLFYHNPRRLQFSEFGRPSFSDSLSGDFRIYCFNNWNDQLLIGTMDGIYSAFENKDGMPGTFTLMIPGIRARVLFKSSSGQLWIGAENGLYSLGKNGKANKVLDVFVFSIMESTSGDLILGIGGNGLIRFNEKTQTSQLLFDKESLIDVRHLLYWNGFWAGFSSNGLFFVDPKKHEFRYATDKRNSGQYPQLPPDVRVLVCMFSDKNGLLWMGTYGGLYMWDPRTRRLYRLTIEEGLVNNSIKAIIEDNNGSVWVTTSRGISRVDKIQVGRGYEFSIVNYNKNDGVKAQTFTGRAAYLSPSSELYFGGLGGFNTLKRNLGRDTISLFPVLFDFKLFGKNIEAGNLYNNRQILKKSITSTDTVLLNFDQNFFSIRFSAPNYLHTTETHYRYMLSGVDKMWRHERPSSGFGEASYTDLSPGRYVFKVMASVDGYNWPGKVRELAIIIKPPFWATTFAKIAYVLVLIAAILIGIKFYKKRERISRQRQQDVAVQQEKSKFITNISHDLRTPLTLILTPLQSIIPNVENTQLKTDLKHIENSAELLLDTVNQLLEFRRIDEAGETLHLNLFDSLSFIAELSANYIHLAKEKSIDFHIDVDDRPAEIWMDKKKVVRIIMNLLSNAIKFTPAGGIVAISATLNKDTGNVEIRVTDSGVGIAAIELDKIFDRFYQSDNQDFSNSSGTGIGLYVVRYYAELHGGYADVVSEQGQETTFTVMLNVASREEPEKVSEQSGKKSVLVVEDQEVFRSYLKRALESQYHVMVASNGVKALKNAIDARPDLIITDMMLPGMSGTVLCREVRKNIQISHTPIIMLTARSSDEAKFEGYESGADAYLVKPFDLELLKLRIRKLLQLFDDRRKLFNTTTEIEAENIASNPLDKDLLERALQCVNENLSNPDYSVEKFSADMYMDRTGLYRKLLALTGQSPVNFIRTIRLNKAAALLDDKVLSVAKIAEEVGFNGVSYFSKCFQEKFGKSPKQYQSDSA